MKLDELILIMPNKKNVNKQDNSQKWVEVEKNLQMKLPKEYKQFIDEYGTGSINDFIWILTPFDEDENINFIEKGDLMKVAYRLSKQSNPAYFKHDIFPEKDGLLPWGYSENGDELYWLTQGEPSKWRIVVYESRSCNYYEYDLDLITFIYELVSKKIISPAFPDDLFEEGCEYISY